MQKVLDYFTFCVTITVRSNNYEIKMHSSWQNNDFQNTYITKQRRNNFKKYYRYKCLQSSSSRSPCCTITSKCRIFKIRKNRTFELCTSLLLHDRNALNFSKDITCQGVKNRRRKFVDDPCDDERNQHEFEDQILCRFPAKSEQFKVSHPICACNCTVVEDTSPYKIHSSRQQSQQQSISNTGIRVWNKKTYRNVEECPAQLCVSCLFSRYRSNFKSMFECDIQVIHILELYKIHKK